MQNKNNNKNLVIVPSDVLISIILGYNVALKRATLGLLDSIIPFKTSIKN